MKNYMLYLEQNPNSGCDYTIGCGKKLVTLNSNNKEDALIEMKLLVGGICCDDDISRIEYENKCDNYGYYPDDRVEKALLLEITNITIVDVNKIHKEADVIAKRKRKEEETAEEKALLEKLKKKYEEI